MEKENEEVVNFTEEEILADLMARFPTMVPEGENWITAAQAEKVWGCKRSTAENRLGMLVSDGLYEVKKFTSPNGRRLWYFRPLELMKDEPDK